MKIDSTDIREFDAKQLSVEFTPPQTTVTVDMFEGALIPSESETYTPLSGITVEVLFRGKDRDEVMTHISDFNALLQKGVDFHCLDVFQCCDCQSAWCPPVSFCLENYFIFLLPRDCHIVAKPVPRELER